jgi:hypothetical protein
MIGRRAIAGLSLLSALFFCALAAQSASAAAHTSENTTAFTCVKEGGKLDFKDEHCDETVKAGEGKFGHVLIPAGPTTIEATNEKTAEKTTKSTPATLKGSLLGVETHIICEVVKSTTEDAATKNKSVIENGGVSLEHKVTGTIILDFEKCKVEKPANCKIKEPLVFKASFMGVDKLAPEEKGMGLEFTGDGTETFTEITYEGEKCALKGNTFPTKGNVIGTGTPGPTAKESGTTLIFNEEAGMQNLTFGGKPLTFIGALTIKMHSEIKNENPITLTTTT